jgi:hypothetical protein
MRRLATRCAALVLLLSGSLLVNPADAQDGSKYLAVGPVFVKDSIRPFVMDTSFGAEHREGPVGVGAEMSWLYFPPAVYAYGSADAASLLGFSVYTAFHFVHAGGAHGIEPFVRLGLGGISDFSSVGWWSIEAAGGADLRLGKHVALRTAIRGGQMNALGFETSLVIR